MEIELPKPRYAVSRRKLFGERIKARSIPLTDDQWGRIYQQARLEYKAPGTWMRDNVLVILDAAEKNRKPR